MDGTVGRGSGGARVFKGMTRTDAKRHFTTARVEGLVLSCLALTAFGLSVYFDLAEFVQKTLTRGEHWQFDEMMLAATAALIGFSVFSFRRSRQYHQEARRNRLINDQLVSEVAGRIRAEGELAKSHESLERAQQIAKIGSWEWSPREKSVVWSDQFYRILGYEPGEREAHLAAFIERVHPDDQSFISSLFKSRFHDENAFREEIKIIRPDGEIRHLHAELGIERNEVGEATRIQGTIQDVTDRRQADRASRLLASIVESTEDAIIGVRLDGTVFSWNDAARDIFGYDRSQIIDEHLSTLDSPDLPSDVEGLIEAIKRGGHVSNAETVRRKKNGQTLDVAVTASPITEADGSAIGMSMIVRDITAHKKTRDHLAQSQKMEALGQLTGGVAHDFNNLLSVIVGNTELVQDKVDGGDEFVDNILRSAARGAELTQRLLSYSRRQTLRPKSTDLVTFGLDIEGYLSRMLGAMVDLSIEMDDQLWAADVDPGQLENAILNLAINARDAMELGGPLKITARNITFDDFDRDRPADLAAGAYVALSVEDSGAGMPDTVLASAYQPFFTTKPMGEGSGLGLSMVYGFARQSGGDISIKSVLGQGTSVTLFLPRARVDPAPPMADVPPETWTRGKAIPTPKGKSLGSDAREH